MSRHALDRRQKAVIALSGILRATSGGILGTALVVYVGRAGTPFAVGMLATAFHLATMVCSPLWGALADTFGRRRVLLLALGTLTSVAALVFVFVRGVWGLVAMRGVYAVFAVGFALLLLTVVSSMGGRRHRGRAVGFFHSVMAAGDVLAQASVGVLLGLLYPSGLYLLVAALSGLGTVVLVALDEVGESPHRESAARRPATDGSGDTRRVLREVRARLLPSAAERALMRRTGLSWLYVGLALRHVAVRGVGALVPIYLLTEVGVSAVTMGLLLTLAPATQIGFMTLFGRAADVRGRKWLVVLGIVASGVYPFLLGSATLPGSAAGQVAVAGAGLVSIAAGFSAMDVGVVALLGDAVPASREAAFLGLRSTVGGLGGVVGPTLVGSVAVLASYQVAFALAGLLALGAAALVNDRVVEPESTDSTSLAPERTELATQMVEPPGAFRDADSVED